MSIQNLAIIFIVIAIPIIIVSSYYVNQQQETLKMQANYDLKLGEATREAIKAYEINTVEWADKKENTRDHALAVMNVFTTSLANQLNISGTAKEYMENYIPAIAMTMYDGYYIYAPTYVPVTLKTEDGTQLFYDMENDLLTTESEDIFGRDLEIIYEPKEGYGMTINYTYTTDENIEKQEEVKFVIETECAKKKYEHTLTNQIPYSERYSAGNINVAINYTLDNLVYIYGNINGNYVEKKGYLINFGQTSLNEIPQVIENEPDTLKNGSNLSINYDDGTTNYTISGEYLEEQIVYYENGEYKLGTFNYVYDTKQTKLYYDEEEQDFFSIKLNKERNFISTRSEVKYKSVSVLKGDTDLECTKFYQALNGSQKGLWFFEETANSLGQANISGLDIKLDYSAVSYYVEAYAFTNWVNGTLGSKQGKEYLKIGRNNDPENENSLFSQHRKEIIKNSITSNLNIAISNYSESGVYDFRLPVLTDSDWEQIYNNISFITFFQGVPIGTKYYNNYAIATSSTNREFVNTSELYLVSNDDEYYHKVTCKGAIAGNYTAYKSVDFELKENYISNGNSLYYYAQPKKGCYYCIINREGQAIETINGTEYEKVEQIKSAYYKALARERYINANT